MQDAGTAHLEPLLDDPSPRTCLFRLEIREQTRERSGRRASRRVLTDTMRRRKHPRAQL